MSTIFVQIASYRDPELTPTLNSLLGKATNPQHLRVAVCWQHSDDETFDVFTNAGFELFQSTHDPRVDLTVHTFSHPTGAQLFAIDVDFHKSQGACWARNKIQQIYTDETYTLQLDSHHRFIAEWDTVLVEMFEDLKKTNDKPLLTAYLPVYNPETDPVGRGLTPLKMDFDRFIPEGCVFFLPANIPNIASVHAPVPARFFSAHFAFAAGAFAKEVQHDPEYFFHGEEISLAVRAYTHGYNLFHPHKLIAWHEYTRKGRTKIWDDHTGERKAQNKIETEWWVRNTNCHKRNRILFGMDGEDPKQIDFGKYGFGPARTLLEYEQYAGISFEHRGVQQKTVNNEYPPGDFVFENPEQWKNTFVGSHDIRILVHRSELGELQDDYDFWYVGSADADGKEIFRKDVPALTIKDYVKNEWIDFRLVWLGDKEATHFVVWPHSIAKGWGEKITKPVNN